MELLPPLVAPAVVLLVVTAGLAFPPMIVVLVVAGQLAIAPFEIVGIEIRAVLAAAVVGVAAAGIGFVLIASPRALGLVVAALAAAAPGALAINPLVATAGGGIAPVMVVVAGPVLADAALADVFPAAVRILAVVTPDARPAVAAAWVAAGAALALA